MSKLNIFLADLEHNYNKSPHNAMPYAIGLIASYAKKILNIIKKKAFPCCVTYNKLKIKLI